MSEHIGEQFIDALHDLEHNRNLDRIAGMYADNAEIGNVVAPEKFHGQEGARDFWNKYRSTFGEMNSEFRNRIYTDGRAALEWTTTATSSSNEQIQYSGVSIIEIENDKITRFQAYFNSLDLGKQIEGEAAAKHPQAVE